MDKYINATKLINDIKSRCYTSDFGTTLAVGFAITQLENAPEAIVHCKDCKYWSNDIPTLKLKFPEYYGKCDKTYDDEYGDYNITREEWFCPLGELRC